MNYLDLILGGLIVYGAVKGFFKGLIIEAASLAALLPHQEPRNPETHNPSQESRDQVGC